MGMRLNLILCMVMCVSAGALGAPGQDPTTKSDNSSTSELSLDSQPLAQVNVFQLYVVPVTRKKRLRSFDHLPGCPNDAIQFVTTSNFDSALKRHVFRTAFAQSPEECANLCHTHFFCRSAGYEPSSNRCLLSYKRSVLTCDWSTVTNGEEEPSLGNDIRTSDWWLGKTKAEEQPEVGENEEVDPSDVWLDCDRCRYGPRYQEGTNGTNITVSPVPGVNGSEEFGNWTGGVLNVTRVNQTEAINETHLSLVNETLLLLGGNETDLVNASHIDNSTWDNSTLNSGFNLTSENVTNTHKNGSLENLSLLNATIDSSGQINGTLENGTWHANLTVENGTHSNWTFENGTWTLENGTWHSNLTAVNGSLYSNWTQENQTNSSNVTLEHQTLGNLTLENHTLGSNSTLENQTLGSNSTLENQALHGNLSLENGTLHGNLSLENQTLGSNLTLENQTLGSNLTLENHTISSNLTLDNQTLHSNLTLENHTISSNLTLDNQTLHSNLTLDNQTLHSNLTLDNQTLHSNLTIDNSTLDLLSNATFENSTSLDHTLINGTQEALNITTTTTTTLSPEDQHLNITITTRRARKFTRRPFTRHVEIVGNFSSAAGAFVGGEVEEDI